MGLNLKDAVSRLCPPPATRSHGLEGRPVTPPCGSDRQAPLGEHEPEDVRMARMSCSSATAGWRALLDTKPSKSTMP